MGQGASGPHAGPLRQGGKTQLLSSMVLGLQQLPER